MQGIRAVFEPNAAILSALAETPDEAEAVYLLTRARMESASRTEAQ